MKLHQFLLAILAAPVLLSCQKEANEVVTPDDNQEKVPMKITLTVGDNTRAVNFPENSSLDTEKRIYNAIGVAFNKDSRLEAVAEFDKFADGGVDVNNVVLEFEAISTGSHTFFVIANANTTLLRQKDDLFEMGMNISVFQKKIVELNSVNEIIREKLTNGNTTTETTRGFLMTSDRPYVTTISADSNNEINVTMIRTVAKVSLAFEPVTSLFGTLTDVEYKIVHNPKQAYIFPVEEDGLLMTPLYGTTNYYAGNFIPSAHGYQEAITTSTPAGSETYTYCVENHNMIALEGNTTMALIKGVFIPDEVLDADGTSLGAQGAGTFYRLRNEHGIWDPDFYTVTPNSIPAGYEVVEYTDGICYYGAYLHPANASDYMVKRNSFVKMTVTAVNGPGEPGEGDVVDPEKPIGETADAAIKVVIADWEEDNQSTPI